MTLRVSHLEKEGVYQGSKWLKYQVLCDEKELEKLFEKLRPFHLFHMTGIGDGKPLQEEVFLQTYASWIDLLKKGRVPEEKSLRKILAAAITRNLDALWIQEVPAKGYLIKISKPLIQIQAHFFTYSKADGVFRPMSMGMGSVFWGLQFSYPQIYQDAKTMEIVPAKKEELFETIRIWVREETRATPFVVDGKRTNAPIRLGRNCFSWIASHPQLKEQEIFIHGC